MLVLVNISRSASLYPSQLSSNSYSCFTVNVHQRGNLPVATVGSLRVRYP